MAFHAGPRKSFPVKVSTMDADLEFTIEVEALGRDLFDLVCRTIGLREIWYFGLQFMSTKGTVQWLQMGKKVLKQHVDRSTEPVHFHFLVKYFPENVEEELIQDTTKHLFFLQVMESVVSGGVYCPAEASVLLASFAVQAREGDADVAGDGVVDPEALLPAAVIGQYHMTPPMWTARIRTWWLNNKGLSREEAELEYLKIAQDLDQYGIHFFPIHNKKESSLWLGVCPTGVNIYKADNRLVPEIRFQWKEILNISYRNKKGTVELMIKVMDEGSEGQSKHWVASTESMETCQVILDLCVGSHNLYLSRRKADSVEVQAMKAQAQEARERRIAERTRLEEEMRAREAAEEERDVLRAQLDEAQAQLRAQAEILARTEGTAELLAEKARVSEEEILALTKRAAEAEAEAHRNSIAQLRAEEERTMMERKAREAEALAQRLLGDDRRHPPPPTASVLPRRGGGGGGVDVGGGGYERAPPDPPSDIRSLSAQIERERAEYAAKSRHLQDQLTDLRAQIQGLKVEENESSLDRIYLENQRAGHNKYASLRKVPPCSLHQFRRQSKTVVEDFDAS